VPASLEIARVLLRPRAVRAAAALALVLGALAGGLPLLETPGYELGQALAFAAALLGPAFGIAAARARASEAPSPLAAWLGASLALAVPLSLAASGTLARAALGPCSALTRATWFVPLLAIPSVLLATALAVAAAVLARGRAAPAVALYVAAALGSLAWTLHGAYVGPAAFAFDPLLGGWPGPLYDEALAPDLRVVLFRCGAALLAIAVVALAELAARARREGVLRGGPLVACLVALGLAAVPFAVLEARGLSGSRAAVTRALGGRRDGPRCTVVFPAEKPAAAADALLADCEFQVADVAGALGIAPPARVTVYAYRSAAEKRRLVGAAATEFAKPWLREVHVVDAPLPHPVLRHELVHAVGAEIADGLLGVPSRRVVLFSAGLVEGLAAALETPRGAWTVHEWSRAARDLGLLPDVAAIVGPAGFYGEPPARAYTAAGSFLAFLLDRHGAAKVREAYRTGDLARAFGVPLATLAAEWHAFLDGIEPPPGLLAAAQERLGRGSVFARRCAREVALLEARAGQDAAEGRPAAACARYEAAAHRSGSPRDLLAAGQVRARAGDLEGAERAYREAATGASEGAAGADVALAAALSAARGDLAWRRGDPAAAIAAWSAALDARPDRAEERLLEAKIVAAGEPALGEVARPLLLGDADPAVALGRLAAVPHPLAAYLVGRARMGRGEAAAAVGPLERAAAGGLPGALRREASLLLGQARCASGARAAGEATLRTLGADASAADRARIAEALRRCAATR
jgi:hypothetical protein